MSKLKMLSISKSYYPKLYRVKVGYWKKTNICMIVKSVVAMIGNLSASKD